MVNVSILGRNDAKFAVIDESTGRVLAVHETKAQAERHQAALYGQAAERKETRKRKRRKR